MKKIHFFIIISFWTFSFSSCNPSTNNNESTQDSTTIERNKEAREDSAKLAEAIELQSKVDFTVTALVETEAVSADINADAADDPAIWINSQNPNKSIVLGTNKKEGLYAYWLDGKIINYRKAGKINNVDLRDGFQYKEQKVVLVAGSNRTNNSISLFYIDPIQLQLSDTIANIQSKVGDVYGVAMYKDAKNQFFIFVNGKDGQFEQWKVWSDKTGIKKELKRTFKSNSQPEGITINDQNSMLYFGVEEEGIFKMSANPDSTANPRKLAGSDNSNPFIAYDIEGISVFHYNKKNYLLASIQGSFSYAIFELGEKDKYINSFKIKNRELDGVEETDGLDIVVTDLLPNFPKGIMIFQDGYNYEGDILKSQNFKFVDFEQITSMLD